MNQRNAILVSSRRFVNAVMALEAGWRHMPPWRTRAEFGVFAEDVEKMLELLAKMLRGEKVGRRISRICVKTTKGCCKQAMREPNSMRL